MADEQQQLYEEGSFWQRLRESPRTVSALIIILIVAAAIYAFSGDENANVAQTTIDDEAAMEEGADAVMEESDDDGVESAEAAAGEVAAQTDGQAPSEEPAEPLPEPRMTGEGYVEVAQAGEGYTHLARRATGTWLESNTAEFDVTDEHRIYIEDYLQNQMGSDGMALGQEHTITFAMIDEAVRAAGELSEQQLQNLSQYTHVLQT